MIEAPDIERLRSMVLEAEEQREASWPAILKLCLVVSGFKALWLVLLAASRL